MSFGEGFAVYLKISPEQTGIDEGVFFPDLLDFLIWEDYGLTDDGIEGYFRRLSEGQADLCVEHLRHEVPALLDDDLEYQSEEAPRSWVRWLPSRSGSTSSRLSPGKWGQEHGSGSSASWTGR